MYNKIQEREKRLANFLKRDKTSEFFEDVSFKFYKKGLI